MTPGAWLGTIEGSPQEEAMEPELSEQQWKQVSRVLDYILAFPKTRTKDKKSADPCTHKASGQDTPPKYAQERLF